MTTVLLKIKLSLWIIAGILFLAVVTASAAEVEFPVPAYTGEELAKVREWEKTWAGKKIDATNVDQVAEFLLSALIEIIKDPVKWNAPPDEGYFFYIGPYKRVMETKGMIEATKKYSPLVKRAPDGRILNYADIAGMPFPDPKTGFEVAYNWDMQTRGDTYEYDWYAPSINPRTKTDRLAEQKFIEMFFVHRVDVDPRPALSAKQNPKGYMKGQFMHMYLPPEMNNTRFITMRSVDYDVQDVSYLYYAQFRRIRRLSTTERTNAIDGTDQIYDDGNMWDGHISRNTYTLKGKKELLLSRHQDMDPKKVTRVPGQAIPNGYTYERCNTYVVEAVNKDPNYLYSKRVWYIDPESYIIHQQEMYDKLGRYWKWFSHHTNDIKTAKGEMKNAWVGYDMEDVQRTHSGFTRMKYKGIGIDVSPDIFTLSNLQRTY